VPAKVLRSYAAVYKAGVIYVSSCAAGVCWIIGGSMVTAGEIHEGAATSGTVPRALSIVVWMFLTDDSLTLGLTVVMGQTIAVNGGVSV
jgi:hypothetical protein